VPGTRGPTISAMSDDTTPQPPYQPGQAQPYAGGQQQQYQSAHPPQQPYEPTQHRATPSPQRVTISAGTAFKAGFFGFFGWFVAALIVGTIVSCVAVLLGAVLADFVQRLF
jgi:hypothetical protein